MKNLLLIGILFTGSFLSAQNNVYIITEKCDGMVATAPTYDSVYVTNPAGVTTKYSIPNYIENPGAHNTQFNIILNGITSQGYKLIGFPSPEGISNTALPNPYGTIKTFYLVEP